MFEALRIAIKRHVKTARWYASTTCSETGCRVYVHLGDGTVFRARGQTVGQAEARAAAKINEWASIRLVPTSDGDLCDQLEASIAVARAKRGRPALRVIKGGKS